MSTDMTERELAAGIALRSTEEFGFDCREILSSALVGNLNGDSVFRVIIRLWSSPELIDNTIANSGEGQDIELMREILSEGNKIAVEATRDRIVKQEWLGIQFS